MMNSSHKPLISVVMGTYNQGPILEKILAGYQTQTLAPTDFEVIVVDSSSSDETGNILEKMAKQIPLVSARIPNRGKAGARNEGMRIAKADLILITDADIIPHPNLLKAHVDAHQKTTEATVYEGLEYNMKILHWPPEPQYLYPTLKRQFKTGKKLHWGYCLTGNLSFSRQVLEKLGDFDTDFVGYGFEDLEWGYRLSEAKIPLRYLAEAINYHYHLIDAALEIDRAEAKAEGAAVFIKKHPEIAWFLGKNPVTKALVSWLSPDGFCLNFVKKGLTQSPDRIAYRVAAKLWQEYRYLRHLYKK